MLMMMMMLGREHLASRGRGSGKLQLVRQAAEGEFSSDLIRSLVGGGDQLFWQEGGAWPDRHTSLVSGESV